MGALIITRPIYLANSSCSNNVAANLGFPSPEYQSQERVVSHEKERLNDMRGRFLLFFPKKDGNLITQVFFLNTTVGVSPERAFSPSV